MALYAYARRAGSEPAPSAGRVRRFSAYIAAGRLGHQPASQRDRLRTFLLASFQEFLTVQELTARRNRMTSDDESPTDFGPAEAWLAAEPPAPPETTFHRAWARCILLQSYEGLGRELSARYGPSAADLVAAEVSPLERRPFNPDLAAKLRLNTAEVLDMLRWARRRVRELIQNTIRETVSSTPEVEVEFWDLFTSV